jgi:hypothetical protein
VAVYENLRDLLQNFRDDLNEYHGTGEFTPTFFDALLQFYSQSGDMTYGTVTATTSDPVMWIERRLALDLKAL